MVGGRHWSETNTSGHFESCGASSGLLQRWRGQHKRPDQCLTPSASPVRFRNDARERQVSIIDCIRAGLGRPSPVGGADRAWCDLPLNAIPDAIVLEIEVVLGLKVQPEPLGGPKVAGQPQRGVDRDRARAADDLVDSGGGTPMSLASRYWLISIGLRNSSRNTSPGWTGASRVAMVSPQW
jgi:hypothetical protein